MRAVSRRKGGREEVGGHGPSERVERMRWRVEKRKGKDERNVKEGVRAKVREVRVWSGERVDKRMEASGER